MDDKDYLKDILMQRISNQVFYNQVLVEIRNPEVRNLFTQMRDDEMRAIVKLQQKIDRMETRPGIISKILPSRTRY